MPSKKLKVTLTVIEGQNKGESFDLEKSLTVLGRLGCDIPLKDAKISRKHATIEIRSDGVHVKDLGSTNGIFVNDLKVEEVKLKNLDELTLGFTRMSVAIIEDLKSFKEHNIHRHKSSSSSKSASKKDIGNMIAEELLRFSRWDVSGESPGGFDENQGLSKVSALLEVIDGPDKGKRSKLKRGSSILGRGKKADISFKDTDISRAHAEIEISGKEQAFVRDLGSTNGTYLNGRRVSYSRIKNDDLVQIGATTIKFIFAE